MSKEIQYTPDGVADELDMSDFDFLNEDQPDIDFSNIDIDIFLSNLDLDESNEEKPSFENTPDRVHPADEALDGELQQENTFAVDEASDLSTSVVASDETGGNLEGETKASRRRFHFNPVVVKLIGKTVLVLLCVALSCLFLVGTALTSGGGTSAAQSDAAAVTILDKFDMFMNNEISSALDGVLSIEKVYWLSDSDQVAPKPNPDNYGEVATPAELMWLFEEAKDLIGDEQMIFNEDMPVWDADKIYYYYDETILVVTWKVVIERVVYTMSEVKIAHPSQFRRFLANGEFGSDKQYVTTEMAQSVNAVMATSGDFYKFRPYGVVVYEGEVKRFEGNMVDTCFIDDKGDLLFALRKEIKTKEEAQQFVEENNIRFSLAFGPVLIENGEVCVPDSYVCGEINEHYSRAAICQQGELHYLVVSAAGGGPYNNRHTTLDFAKNVASFGVKTAYALDGGQTTVVAMDGEAINFVDFGFQRKISDIIYFATALPDGG